METVAQLFDRLEGDAKRKTVPFRPDIREANELLHNRAAFDDEMMECLEKWCVARQPCQFGRAAAAGRRIHFSFLREEALLKWSDQEIAAHFADEKRLWKQRAAFGEQRAAHSFVLVVASPRVALAAPDANLKKLSERLLELTGWANVRKGARAVNTIASDYLYLRNPNDGRFFGYQFNIDFFACAGDGRWWHDHRFPGGIAFTANSTGHMRFFREWYEKKTAGQEWALKQAMLTIQNAAPAGHLDAAEEGAPVPEDAARAGRVTWLLPLGPDGKPFVSEVACPLTAVPKSLQGKDWTRYEGLLHTDHAVREEFFRDREIAPTMDRPYLMDFTYLYDERQPDFESLTGGRLFTEEEVFRDIGRPDEWSHRNAAFARPARGDAEAAIVAEQLAVCERWQTPSWFAQIE